MRLQQIDDSFTLFEALKFKNNDKMSYTKTKNLISAWYNEAMFAEQEPSWMRQGEILSHQAAMNSWLVQMGDKICRLQRLDEKWMTYVTLLHYEHYLINRREVIRLKQTQIDAQAAEVEQKLASTQQQITNGWGSKMYVGDKKK